MSSRKKHCIGECDYNSYYLKQAGNGFSDITVFRGNPYQRGYGIGSLFKRFGLPLAKFFGKHLLQTGIKLGSDILDNKVNKGNKKSKLKVSSNCKRRIPKGG